MDDQQDEPILSDALSPAAAFEADIDSYAGDSPARRGGWTPFSRRLFLQVLAETGRVSTACDYTGLTRQSAYALRARDAIFAAGWDAACELARAPLADALYEKALDGVTDIITRNGEIVAERHRFDSRLSIAVLHRLDKRCDRAEERGSEHLALLRCWDQWLTLVGRGDDAAAMTILDDARHCQFRQLAEGANPMAGALGEPGGADDDDEESDLSHRFWKDECDGVWTTDLPPPDQFAGYQSGPYGDPKIVYKRACTDEETALLEADRAADVAAEFADQAGLRDRWFAMLKEELGAGGPAGP